jgi:hypothetical protein
MKKGIDVHTIKIMCHKNKEELNHYLVYLCFQISKRTKVKKGKNREKAAKVFNASYIFCIQKI